MLQLSDFDYVLPQELIAAFPPADRTSARLLKVDRFTGKFSHHTFCNLTEFLKEGDLLVLNNTKVIPARIFGKKETGGKVEGMLLRQKTKKQWEVLLRPGGRIKKDAILEFGENGTRLAAKVLDDSRLDSGGRLLEFQGNDILARLKKIGHIPLPPYIDRPDCEIDQELYQTVFAEKEGAVASPTAGLHFDLRLLNALQKKGIEIAYVTLHVGYGTFQPVTSEDLSRHQMFAEEFEISPETAAAVNQALQEKRRVIACGTTSVRALESATYPSPSPLPTSGERGKGEGIKSIRDQTRLFIYPPYSFKIVSGLITNFHLPKSTLLLLVAAFLEENGRNKLFGIYKEAIRRQYRFYSYGDAMIIL